MGNIMPVIEDFLAQKCIIVAGVSRTRRDAPANQIYRKLREADYEVFPVNPNAEAVEGDRCYPDVRSVPGNVDGVVIATTPSVTEEIVRQCADRRVTRVWIHRSIGVGSVSDAATQFCRDHDIAVIPGGCPMMWCRPVDLAHMCMRWMLGATGRALGRGVELD